jgi:hypothetical protein
MANLEADAAKLLLKDFLNEHSGASVIQAVGPGGERRLAISNPWDDSSLIITIPD